MSTKAEIEAVKQSFIDNNVMHYLKALDLPTLIIVGQHGERTQYSKQKKLRIISEIPNLKFLKNQDYIHS